MEVEYGEREREEERGKINLMKKTDKNGTFHMTRGNKNSSQK